MSQVINTTEKHTRLSHPQIKTYCGECPFFIYEDIDGYGLCNITRDDIQYRCDDKCIFAFKEMTLNEVHRVLHFYQKYRRGGDKDLMPPPSLIGVALDNTIRYLRKEIRKQNIVKK